jgi:tetratricopeptide (TPR) repeat protein
MTNEARALITARGDQAGLSPELALERALADLKDGPPENALSALAAIADGSPEAQFRYAEAMLYCGQADSALTRYQRIARDPRGAFAGASLERIYLIEEARPRDALPVFGRLAYEEWRGETKRATALADSLYRILPRGPSWAQAALMLSGHLEAGGDAGAALAPLLAVADSLPDERLAPVARQRAGDIYLLRLKDEARALEQYEECLARYPRAWNAPEVRRNLETLRQERRF